MKSAETRTEGRARGSIIQGTESAEKQEKKSARIEAEAIALKFEMSKILVKERLDR